MALDVLANYAEATTSGTGGTTASTSDTSVTVASISGSFPALTAGVTQLRVMDKAQLQTIGGEVMLLTADAGGAAGTWTVTRAVEGTLSSHSTGWVMVPVNTSGGLDGRYLSMWGALNPVAGQSFGIPVFDSTLSGYTTPPDQKAYFSQFILGKATTISKAYFNVTSAASTGGTFRIGVYNETGGAPSTLVAGTDTGPLATTTTGDIVGTLASPVVLPAGVYWMACVAQGAPTTSAALRAYNTPYYNNWAVPLHRLGLFAGTGTAYEFNIAASYSQTSIGTGGLPLTATPSRDEFQAPIILWTVTA